MENFHLLGQIGEGAFGRVYKARRKFSGCMVAIKMISKLHQAEDDLISFRREMQILEKMDHPNIMRLLQIIETDTDFCVVSELAHGDLFQIIQDGQTLPEEVLRDVAVQILSALSHLHSNRIIHRDIKPQNVLIGADGTLKLCDFGFARALSCTTLVLTSIKGTPLYMAPELMQEQPYTEKIDIWALGVILYELYCGRPPFFADSIYKLVQMIINEPITWPEYMSPDFQDFLKQMMQKNAEYRISCDELLRHPFVARAKPKTRMDWMYRYKSEEFEKALVEAAGFVYPEGTEPDMYTVFMNPSKYSDDQKLSAVRQWQGRPLDSVVENTFAFAFKQFITSPKLAAEALKLATQLLIEDSSKFVEPFTLGVELLGWEEFPSSGIDFFMELLVKPFAFGRINMSASKVDLKLTIETAAILRDNLLRLLSQKDTFELEKAYGFISYLVQASFEFLSVVSKEFAPRFMEILAQAVIGHQSNLITALALTTISKVIENNRLAFQSIASSSDFYDALFPLLKEVPNDFASMACFSAAVNFCSTAFQQLLSSSGFLKRIPSNMHLTDFSEFMPLVPVLLEQTVKALLSMGEKMPTETADVISYIAITASPFAVLPLDDLMIDACISRISYLLPFHVVALLTAILTAPNVSVVPYLQQLLSLFRIEGCAALFCDFVLSEINKSPENNSELIDTLCEAGAIPALCGVIRENGDRTPASAYLVLTHIVLVYSRPSPILTEHGDEIIDTVVNIDNITESGLIIASHFARLSPDFVPSLLNSNALAFAQKALQSDSPVIRARACSLIGNIAKHVELQWSFIDRAMPALLAQLKANDLESEKFAAYAIGNILYRSDAGTYVIPEIRAVKDLVNSSDAKAVEYGAYLVANLVRRSETYIDAVVKEGILDRFGELLMDPEKITSVIQPISVFCLSDKGQDVIKSHSILSWIQKHTDSRKEIVRTTASTIVRFFSKS